jgi:myosin heavy subunit
METLYVWLFIFAGVTMIVQGILLLASERELRKQRREIDMLRRSHRPSEPELLTRNKELLETISSLSAQLEESKRTVEELQREQRQLVSAGEKALEAEQQRLGDVNLENQQLRVEIESLQSQFQTSETRLSKSAWQNQEVAECYARLQTEVVELKQKAKEGQARIGELEAVQEQLGMVESREMILRDQQHKQEAQIADLQRELSMGKQAVQELDVTCERLAGIERVCQELREENRRLEEEISLRQKRLAESEETQTQVRTLRQQLEELRAKQAAVSEANSLIDGLSDRSGKPIDLSSNDSATRAHGANDEQIKPPVAISETKKRRFGIIPATGSIAIVTAVAAAFLNTSFSKPSGSKEPVIAPETVSIEQSSPIEDASKTVKRARPASGDNESSQQVRRRVQGTFKITRPTQVYSGPSGNSRLIANIEPGMKINVVDSRDGWLEIRSKHGRPSGFVRQAAAVRIDQN